MTVKERCLFHRELRRKLAEKNRIPVSAEDCGIGECTGICDACRQEIQDLLTQLRKKREADWKALQEQALDADEIRQRLEAITEEEWEAGAVLDFIPTEEAYQDPEPDLTTLILKLGRAGIVTFREIQDYTAGELQQICEMTDREIYDLACVMAAGRCRWKNGPRHLRREDCRIRIPRRSVKDFWL